MDTTPKPRAKYAPKKRTRYILDFDPHHAQLLLRAAELTGESLAGFIRRNSLEAAAKALKNRELRQLALPQTAPPVQRTGTEG